MLKRILLESARNAIPEYRQAEVEAKRDGARCIEAEHMLLALTAGGTETGRLLNEVGLDRDRLAAALLAERSQSLAYAGIELPPESLPGASGPDRPIFLGTSAKEALRRGMHSSHRAPRARPARLDLLIGILQAELGTVPRALAIAGIDRVALISRARGEIGKGGVGATARPC